MSLRGQYGERGYAMAALLVMLAVMLVLMTAALPAWRFQAKREKEAELVFRGEQYARAIYLYQRKGGPGAFPPSIDILVQGHFLRKKYKDPMTEDGEFQTLQAGVNPGPATGRGQPGAATGGRQTGPGQTGVGSGFPGGGQVAPGGIIGVVSKSKDASIRIYRGATHYNQWMFTYQNIAGRMGGPGGRGGPGIGPGGQPRPGMPGAGPGGRGLPGRGGPGVPGGRGTIPGGRGGPGSIIRTPG